MPKPPNPPSNPPLTSRPRPPASSTSTPTTTPNQPPKDTTIPKHQDLPHLQKTLSTLPSTLALLTAFHHRNKNQHRLSPWWSHFDRLRRHLGKFLSAVEARVNELERLGRLSAKARARARRVAEDGEGDDQGGGDEVLVRAGYLRGGVVPGGFLFVFFLLLISLLVLVLVLGGLLTDTSRAFSQLTADRQFAHLGVFLLGVLGEVDAAVGRFVAEDEGQQGGGEIASADDAVAAVPVGEEEIDVAVTGEEMGVAVVRGEMGTAVARGNVVEEEREEKVTVVKKKKKARGDEFDDIFGALEGNPPAKRVKKKKKAKGDEFDDIFGGL